MRAKLNNNEQNGCQPQQRPPPLPPPPQSVQGTGSDPDEQKPICRKYAWGTCTKDANCKFRHELNIDEMKKILKFCHDYQNKQGCKRPGCTYLHASRDEQNLFLATGQLPRVLAERYSAMSAKSSTFESVPQMSMYVKPPPLPPPPPPPPQTAAPPVPPLPVQQPLPSSSMQTTSAIQPTLIYTGPASCSTPVIFTLNQPPPPLPPMFDVSRPPPPIPGQTQNAASKRRLDNCEAGPSKISKHEGPKVPENSCENCLLRELRIDLYNEEMDKLHYEKEHLTQQYKKKLEEFENGKEILRSLVSPDLYRILDEYIEGGPPQIQDVLPLLTPLNKASSSMPKQFMAQLLDFAITNSRSVESAPSTSLRLDDPVMQSLSTLTRRTNSYSNSSSSELVHAILQVLCNSKTTIDRSHNMVSRSKVAENSALSSPSASRFANGQKTESHSKAGGARSAGKGAGAGSGAVGGAGAVAGAGRGAVAGAGRGARAGAGGGDAAAPGARAVPAVPSRPPFYPPYRPGVPPPATPPTRPYYPQPYAAPPAVPPNVQFNASPRLRPPAATQMPVWPSAVAAQRAGSSSVHNEFMMGGFPFPPHFYPPYQ